MARPLSNCSPSRYQTVSLLEYRSNLNWPLRINPGKLPVSFHWARCAIFSWGIWLRACIHHTELRARQIRSRTSSLMLSGLNCRCIFPSRLSGEFNSETALIIHNSLLYSWFVLSLLFFASSYWYIIYRVLKKILPNDAYIKIKYQCWN